jgi:ADP-ribose pyrophosphatase YjhB (NUDIX family)
MDTPWLSWARRLQAIAQTGLTYATSPYDEERYREVRQIAAEMMAHGSNTHVEAIGDLFSRERGYATPKVDVRAAVFQDGRILLVREREDGCWTLPGGWADVGDSPGVTAAREVKEESGFDVRAVKLAAVLDHNRHGHPPIPFHAWKLFFVCELTGGAAATSYETTGVGFFALQDLPPLSLTRVTAAQIELLFEHAQRPDLPAFFD